MSQIASQWVRNERAIQAAREVASSDACKKARDEAGHRNVRRAFEWSPSDEALLRREGLIWTPYGPIRVGVRTLTPAALAWRLELEGRNR
jgi:hypothetical protein